jgi:hypothetical protein
MVRQFQPEQLFSQRVCTFSYIPQDARPLFRKCYIAALTLLDALPEYDESPTANFLHKWVLSFHTVLPALLVPQVPGLGPNGVLVLLLDTIKKNCQQFLEAKWSHLHHTARKLHAQPSPTIYPNDSEIVQNRNDEILFCTVHQQVLLTSVSLNLVSARPILFLDFLKSNVFKSPSRQRSRGTLHSGLGRLFLSLAMYIDLYQSAKTAKPTRYEKRVSDSTAARPCLSSPLYRVHTVWHTRHSPRKETLLFFSFGLLHRSYAHSSP